MTTKFSLTNPPDWLREINNRDSHMAPEFTFPLRARDTPYSGSHIFVVAGEDTNVGRNGLINIMASCVTANEIPVAIIDFGLRPGKAFRAHATEGVKAVHIDPTAADPVVKMIDAIDKLHNHVILLTVGRQAWNIFATFEHLLIESYAKSHKFSYYFVALSHSDPMRLMTQHKLWLQGKGYPAFPHRKCARAAPYPSSRQTDDYAPDTNTLIVPNLCAEACKLMFTGQYEADGGPAKFLTFAKTWRELSRGHLMVMKADFNKLFQSLTNLTYQTENSSALPDSTHKDKSHD